MAEWLTWEQAAALVQDGMTLALGGMTLYRRPMAFVRALLARTPRPRDLTLLTFTGGMETDMLIGAGCAKAIRSCYVGLEAFGLAPMFTEWADRGDLTIIEETEASLALGMRARMNNVPSLPSRAWMGTDLPRLRPDVASVADPYSGETMIAFPAIDCDLAVLHGLEADRAGNVAINQNLGVDLELVYLASHTLVTVERVVERVERTAHNLIIPAPGADSIVHAPRGAWPTSCYPDYPLSGRTIMEYVDACSAGQFEQFVEQFTEV